MKLKTLSLLAFAAAAAHPAVVISDGNFTSNWTDSLITSVNTSSATFTYSNPATGGNPTFYRQETHSAVQVSSPPDLAGIQSMSLYTGASYDPSTQGAIASLDFGFDLIQLASGLTPGYGLAVAQNGRVFRYFDGGLVANSSSWTTNSRSGVGANSFQEINLGATTYGGVVIAGQPDFSSAGSSMQFGYIVLNGFGGTAATTTGIDNFSVTINSAVPEPSTYATATAALAALALARRRRSRSKADPFRA